MKKKCKSEVSLVPKKHPDSEQRVKHINLNLQKKWELRYKYDYAK